MNVNRHSTGIRSILNASHVNTAVQLHMLKHIAWTLVPLTVLVFVGTCWSVRGNVRKATVTGRTFKELLTVSCNYEVKQKPWK